MDNDKRNREVNIDRGMAVSRMRHASEWKYIEDIHRDLLKDLQDNWFMPVTKGKSLYEEPNYAYIMANRHGVIEGVKQFFSLLDKYESVYLNSKGEQDEQ